MRRLTAAAVLSAGLVGCAAPPPPQSRSERLLSMAATEAGQVADPQARLKRQLNVADRQDGADARRSLAAAAETMRAAKPRGLPPRIRIAGWVSISKLSRKADDRPTADAACTAAVAALRAVEPEAERAEYAVGVAREVRQLRGKPAAATLLAESAGWARLVTPAYFRRRALAEIADEMFTCDDFTGGLAVLRTDPDPGWRSDTLARLSDGGASWIGRAASATRRSRDRSPSPTPAATASRLTTRRCRGSSNRSITSRCLPGRRRSRDGRYAGGSTLA